MYDSLEQFNLSENVINENSPFSELVNNSFQDSGQDSSSDSQIHYINFLDIGDDALLARIHLIRYAQKSIYIQTFIYKYDESGRFIMKELIQAAKRGVKVYIIVDKLGLEDDPKYMAYLTDIHHNIHVKIYNPSAENVTPSALHMAGEIAFKFKKINQRMHNKLMIFDDQIAITGGRNFQNDYFDKGQIRNFKDRDVLVIGPVVKDMTASFTQYWAFKWSVSSKDFIDVARLIKDKLYMKHIKDEYFEFDERFIKLDKDASDYALIDKKFLSTALGVEKVAFMADNPGKNKKRALNGGGNVARRIIMLLDEAKESIVMQTPYLVLDKATMKEFKKLRKNNKGLAFLISTNSLAATDKVYTYAYSFKQRKKMIKKLGFRIFEFKPVPGDVNLMMTGYDIKLKNQDDQKNDGILKEIAGRLSFSSGKRHLCVHGKSFAIDDKIAWVGSFNLDPRSIHLNTEVGLAIWDEKAAKLLKNNILRDMSPDNSWTVGKVKEVPFISRISGIMGNIVETIPFIDVWPFQYTTLYQLNQNGEEMPYYEDRFYENYTNVGSFPEVGLSVSQIQLRLIEALGGMAEPLI